MVPYWWIRCSRVACTAETAHPSASARSIRLAGAPTLLAWRRKQVIAQEQEERLAGDEVAGTPDGMAVAKRLGLFGEFGACRPVPPSSRGLSLGPGQRFYRPSEGSSRERPGSVDGSEPFVLGGRDDAKLLDPALDRLLGDDLEDRLGHARRDRPGGAWPFAPCRRPDTAGPLRPAAVMTALVIRKIPTLPARIDRSPDRRASSPDRGLEAGDRNRPGRARVEHRRATGPLTRPNLGGVIFSLRPSGRVERGCSSIG